MNEGQVRPGALETINRPLAAMRRAVIDDHEHALGEAVRLDAHELLDQRVERDDPVLRRAPIKDLGSPDIPRGEVAERASALVLSPRTRLSATRRRTRPRMAEWSSSSKHALMSASTIHS